MAKRWLDRFWAFSLVAAAGVLAVLAFPHLASAYHLEAGGRALNNPPTALEHLHKAIEWAPSNAQAYRLLAKAYQAQGDWPAAVEALTHYTELRPDSPLGRIELAELYEMVEAEMARMHVTDLVASLAQAEVQPPDESLDTPYGGPRDSAWHSYVAQTSFGLPPNYGERPTLFMHSPSWVTVTLSLPSQPVILRFDMGMDPQVQNWPGDGVTFEVYANGERIFLEHVDKNMARQGWHERAVDLATWVEQEIALTLAVTPGPMRETTGDWAGWGEPQVVDARLPDLETLNPGVQAVDRWRRAGLTAKDSIARGEDARSADLYEEAMLWYERAMRLGPGLGDPWYYVGLLYEDQKQWSQALDAYEHALALDHFHQVGESSPHFRMGLIHQRRLEPPQLESAWRAYRKALTADDFRSRKEAAWAHARLGQIYYARDGDASAAESEIVKAVELHPSDGWLYVVLGDLYRQEGQTEEARAMYMRALEITSDFETAQERLDLLEEGE